MILTAEDIEFLRRAGKQGQTIPCRHCGGDPPGCAKCHGLCADFCETHCPVCEGMDHHWMPECTDDDGEPVDPHMVCKHCGVIREYVDADE
jgi:hypothetical protein